MKKKTGQEWFDTLSELEQKQFKENDLYFEKRMEEKTTFSTFIGTAFIWEETPKEQGYEYWEKISTR